MADPDLSEFVKLGARNQKRPCQVATARERLEEDEKAALDAALAADKLEISGAAIGAWLKRRNLTVNPQSIAYHRRGECKCADE